DKLIAAQRRGAAALLIAGGELPPPEKTSVQVGLVSGAVTRAAADALLAPTGRTTVDATAALSAARGPAPFALRTRPPLRVDMVGRMQGRSLNVGGGDSGNRLRVLVSDAAQLEGVPLDVHGSPYGPSDHSQFYAAGVPVLFFYTGGHSDYHQPSDTADKIDAAGLARVAAVGARVVERLASDARPVYAQVAQPARRQASGAAAGAFLGVVALPRPGNDGLRLSSVMPGTGAARAGLREGDVIVRFAGIAVEGFEELRTLIRDRKPG